MTSDPSFSTEQAADVLAAVSALQGLDSAAALNLLLSSRKTWLSSQLAAHSSSSVAAGESRSQAVAQLLSSLSQAIQTTMSQVGGCAGGVKGVQDVLVYGGCTVTLFTLKRFKLL